MVRLFRASTDTTASGTEAPTHAANPDQGSASHHGFSTIGELPESSSYFRSIRFRLTAWYTMILVVILISLGMVLRSILLQSLENESNQTLLAAAENIQEQTGRADSLEAIVATQADPPVSRLRPPDLDSYVLSGMWVAIIDLTLGGYLENLTIPDPDVTLGNLYDEIVSVQQAEVQTVTVDGQPNRVLLAPYDPFEIGQVSAVVIVGQSAESQQNTVSTLNQVLVFVGAVGVVLAAGTGWLIAGRALEPVGRITRTAEQIADDAHDVTLSKRLTVPDAGDELSQLALTFNAMLDRIEAAFNTQRRFVADASHELRTPLTAMRGNVDVLLRQIRAGREIPADDLRDALGDVQHESERMARLISDLLTLARTDADGFGSLVKPETISLDVIAQEAFRTAQILAKGQTLTLDVQHDVVIEGDGDRIVQVMIILMENAIRHTPAEGTISLTVGLAQSMAEGTDYARISVTDSGEGIPAEHLPHLFERFYRVEGARTRSQGGTGLGLAIALSIVRGHHGWIDVASGPGKGTTFTVWLPLPTTIRTETTTSPTNGLTSLIPRIGRHRDATTTRSDGDR